MSVNTDQVVQVWPLPDNQYMNSNKQVISDIDDRDIVKYTPNGEYEITASSYANGETNPYVTSNEDDRDFWQCDYKNNPNYKNGKYTQYTQNPYTGGNNASAYQGGGSIKDNLWTTPVGSTKVVNVRGEWIQVKIPFKAYIQQYHIKTPTYTQHNTFPRKFMLVASNDGTTWTQLDQRNIEEGDAPTGADVKKAFNINTSDKYSYFRLIINSMGPNIATVKISELGLFATTMIGNNPNAKSETFITLSRCTEIEHDDDANVQYDGINMYDKQYGQYESSYVKSIDNNEREQGHHIMEPSIKVNPTTLDSALIYGVIGYVLLTGIFYANIIAK